jgi:hypothetical protein
MTSVTWPILFLSVAILNFPLKSVIRDS